MRVLKEQQEKDKRIACPLLVNLSFGLPSYTAYHFVAIHMIPVYSYLMASGLDTIVASAKQPRIAARLRGARLDGLVDMRLRLITKSGHVAVSGRWMLMLSGKRGRYGRWFPCYWPSLVLGRCYAGDLATALRDLDITALSSDERQASAGMISRDIERRRLLAIQRENMAWSKVKSRNDWERFRDQRLNALPNRSVSFRRHPKT